MQIYFFPSMFGTRSGALYKKILRNVGIIRYKKFEVLSDASSNLELGNIIFSTSFVLQVIFIQNLNTNIVFENILELLSMVNNQ